MLCALIMAGGKGTRFWPLSTEKKPKQFLNLIGDKTMIQMTVDRIRPIIPIERIFVCTGDSYVDLVKSQLPDIPEKNIIVEPEGRNTAPCIALSAMIIKKYYNDATMVVLPSDHLIKDEDSFRNILLDGEKYLKENDKAILTLGMTPNRPETGYGYIKFSKDKTYINNNEVIKVDKFVEKPNLEKALEYLADGSYLWNGGMFIWTVNNILDQIKEFIPKTYNALKNIEQINVNELQGYINENYGKTDSISVDYAILEKSNEIYVIPSDFGWDDVGSWEALDRYREKDDNGNIFIGNINSIDSNNNLIISKNHNVIIHGLNDIYIIENDGNIIVGKKEEVSKIKSLKECLV
ncbi:mannose-1-phosphate guanylyltransferase [Clostridium perfringens]|uniref:mannose-1-phosphate guanylyltransferase n=1 Tax=Clostridium perfringens TaxID=1502 RepID=UPI0018E40553|nr:mannose-1-phosphate guanylyltransferase [Clostridium perfringens]MBI5997824.1 mannose-1-phosphate guanylyltransferase [Clostridium perfringens]MDM0472677.1 mannose-1-phosphate guanylyltransferase [Clostridium perfringens]MDM0475917.1 mannose-1-phosphate guanylyltransferase [Clostridium perfringens]MDM0478241.1 mannose-1-phosphate guanylyltransferase [Clostridium perfringens]MDM0481305.1 mannose-1-phosphate guanylyltransferase [Clostridium perfringens]